MTSIRTLTSLTAGAFLLFLQGCLNSDADCAQEDGFTNQEVYFLIDDLGTNYLSFSSRLDTAIPICDQDVIPHDSIGFENIYNVDGAILGDCRAPGCMRPTIYRNPFCVTEIPESEDEFGLLGTWRIAYLEKNNVRMYPSCFQQTEILFFGTNPDSTVYQVLSSLALSNLIVDFLPRNDNSLRISNVIAESTEGPVYLELFERSVLQYFRDTEIITYSIRNNIMVLNMVEDAQIVLFSGS